MSTPVFLYVDEVAPISPDGSSLLSRVEKERDFNHKLLELGQTDEIEAFLADALTLAPSIWRGGDSSDRARG